MRVGGQKQRDTRQGFQARAQPKEYTHGYHIHLARPTHSQAACCSSILPPMSSQLGTEPCCLDADWSDLESVNSEAVHGAYPLRNAEPDSTQYADDVTCTEPIRFEMPDSTQYADVLWYARPLHDILKQWPLPACVQTCKPIRYRDVFTGANTVGIVHEARHHSQGAFVILVTSANSEQGSIYKVG